MDYKIGDTVKSTNGVTHKIKDVCGDTLITDKGMITTGQVERQETGVPEGVEELKAAKDAAYNEELRYDYEFERMMDTGDSISPEPIDKSLEVKVNNLVAKYPRAAVYLQAEDYMLTKNNNKHSAGKEALELIENGGSIAEAEEILESWGDRYTPVWGK